MDAFLHACGVYPALELEVEATSKSRSLRYCLRQPFAIVGRHPAADLYLDSDGIRPRHVYFQAIEGRIACINVSMTGTIQTNVAEVETFAWLEPNESVHFGNRSVKLLQDEFEHSVRQDVADPLMPGSAWEIFGPRITLEILNEEEGTTRKTWLVDRLLTLVGRAPKCAIQLNHDLISNIHCSLVLTSMGLWVVDLLGRGGVLMNEQPVRMAQLGLEDEMRLGPFRIRLQEIPVAISIPEESKAFRPLLTPAGEILLPPPPAPQGSHHQIRMYHTPWPGNVGHADVLEELLEKLQNMHGPMFQQYQQVITKMMATFETLDPQQQEEVKKELKRLHDLSQEVESLENEEWNPDQPGIVLPEEPTSPQVSESAMNLPSDEVRPDQLTSDPPSVPRSAVSLLKDPDTSVFRLPMKRGDLFESAALDKVDPPSSEWAVVETEMLSSEMAREAEQLQQHTHQVAEAAYGYAPLQSDELQPSTTPLELSVMAQRGQSQQARMASLQQEQSSIWKRLSGYIFGKGK